MFKLRILEFILLFKIIFMSPLVAAQIAQYKGRKFWIWLGISILTGICLIFMFTFFNPEPINSDFRLFLSVFIAPFMALSLQKCDLDIKSTECPYCLEILEFDVDEILSEKFTCPSGGKFVDITKVDD